MPFDLLPHGLWYLYLRNRKKLITARLTEEKCQCGGFLYAAKACDGSSQKTITSGCTTILFFTGQMPFDLLPHGLWYLYLRNREKHQILNTR